MSKSAITTIEPIHPGEILKEEFLEPLGMSLRALARHINVKPNRVSQIVKGERSITTDTAVRLGRAFNTTPQFWMNLQQDYDLRVHGADLVVASEVEQIKALEYA
ncbi:MAG: HigA family addiction module antidote protein [Rhodobacteraceae bacterium]|nr:HigA family addiction module antidote protein [Paracoccaceae bacterium]